MAWKSERRPWTPELPDEQQTLSAVQFLFDDRKLPRGQVIREILT
jgi:hypothetical protein